MLAARMHGYKQPLVLEVNTPEISPDQVLVRVGNGLYVRTTHSSSGNATSGAIAVSFPGRALINNS